FEIPDLRVAVAALNSTLAGSHRPEDEYGWVGEEQADWFAGQLAPLEEAGWLRIAVIRHAPLAAGQHESLLRDSDAFHRAVGARLSLLLHGPGRGGAGALQLASGLIAVPAAAPGQHQFLRIPGDSRDRWGDHRGDAPAPARLPWRWPATGGTFPAGSDGQRDSAAGQSVAGGAVPPPEAERGVDPASLLLDRITEVC